MASTIFNMQNQVITMVRGDSLSFGIQIYDQDKALMDIEEAFFSCKKNINDSAYVFQKSIADGIERMELGVYDVRVAPEDTAEIEAGRYFYDMQVRLNSDIFTIMKGVLEIEMNVTAD